MNEREFFLARREAESGLFTRVLDALTKDQFDYRPHDRSQSARELVWTLAHESRACCDLIDTGSLDWRHEDAPSDVDAVADATALRLRLWPALGAGRGDFFSFGRSLGEAAPVASAFSSRPAGLRW